jgi:hypothetical protein
MRHCPSRCIEAELCRLVVRAAAWPGGAVHPGTLGACPSSSLVSRSARVLDYPATLRPNRRPELVVGGT